VRCCHLFSNLLCIVTRHYESPREPGRAEIERDSPVFAYDDNVNIVGENIDTIKKTQKLY
jgi:hypothetical protein